MRRRDDAAPEIEAIIALVADSAGYWPADLLSKRRWGSLVEARHIAMWLARTVCRASLPQLGEAFGDRDHTTILHAVRRIEADMAADAAFAGHVTGLLAQLSAEPAQGWRG